MIRRRVGGVCVAALVSCGMHSPVWAQDPIHKAGRGIVNILTCWIELPKQLHLGTQEDNPVTGVAFGLVKGAGLTILRVGIGAYEAVTFPIPYPKDFASPYDELELTDYAWE